MIVTSSARLTIRRFTIDDAEAMTAVLGDPEVMRFSDGMLSPPEVRRWTARQIARYGNGEDLARWALTETASGMVIGYIALTGEPGRCGAGEAELGFRLARDYWRRGYATEAAAAILEYGFAILRLQRIIAIVDPANAASVRVIEKLGMGFDSLISFPGYDHPD